MPLIMHTNIRRKQCTCTPIIYVKKSDAITEQSYRERRFIKSFAFSVAFRFNKFYKYQITEIWVIYQTKHTELSKSYQLSDRQTGRQNNNKHTWTYFRNFSTRELSKREVTPDSKFNFLSVSEKGESDPKLNTN